jgi:hypothetical protein
VTVIYLLPANPTSPLVSFSALRQRAKRLDYRIFGDRYAETFTLVDTRLGLPVSGLEHVGLPIIANAIESARTTARKKKTATALKAVRRRAAYVARSRAAFNALFGWK